MHENTPHAPRLVARTLTRRDLLATGAMAGGALLIGGRASAQ